MTRRFYTNADPGTTLSTGINASVTSIAVANAGSFPSSTPFAVCMEKGTANLEICLVTAVAGSTLTVIRGYNGTTALSHGTGTSIISGVIALDLDDAAAHIASAGPVHGVAGALVGTTDAQTLANKTLTNPAISNPTVTGTLAGASETLSGTLNVTGTTTLGTVNAGAVSASAAGGSGAVTASGNATGPALRLIHSSPFQNALEIEPTLGGGPVFSVDENGSVVASGSISFSGSEIAGNAFRTTGNGTVDAVISPRYYVNEAGAGGQLAGSIVYLTTPTGAGYSAGLFQSLGGGSWIPLRAGIGRIAGTTFSTDVVSSGATEVVGYSQSVGLISGRRYRVTFQGYMNGGAAGNQGAVNIRYSTAALTNTSTQADQSTTIVHSAAGTPGRGTLWNFAEFVAPSTGNFNIGVGVLTQSGTGNETILGTSRATKIFIDDVGV